MKDIGEKIKSKRLEMGLSQRALAEKANCTYQTIINIEQGKGITVDTLDRVCESLNLVINLTNK